jgi:ribosome-associated protein
LSRRGPSRSDEAAAGAEPPSKSARKREHEALQDLARRALEAPPGRVDRLALDEALALAIRDGRRIPPSPARARHIRYLGKLLAADAQGAGLLGKALADDRAARAEETARLHRVEHWRDRLLAEGDDALAELVAQCPGIAVAQVRDLLRQAHRDAGTPRQTAAVRQLFRLLRSALPGEDTGGG